MKNYKYWRNYATGALFAMLFAAAMGACEQQSGKVPDTDGVSGASELPEAEEEEEKRPKIAGIEIVEYPNMTFFARDQTFLNKGDEYAGLTLKYRLENGEYGETLERTDYTIDPINTSKIGSAVVNISAITPDGEFKTRYGIYVDTSTSILGNFQLSGALSKTAYKLGDAFSMAGISITGTYSGGDKDGQMVTLPASMAVAIGYDRGKRGTQQVRVKLNGREIGDPFTVTVRIPAEAVITLNTPATEPVDHYKTTHIKGMPFNAAGANLKATIKVGGTPFIETSATGGITDANISGYAPGEAGRQTLTLTLDDASTTFYVYAADVSPHVYFDYGFMRTENDPLGVMPGGGYADGEKTKGLRYASVGETLVLAPVRFLIGFDAENKDENKQGKVSYSWQVAQSSDFTASGDSLECFTFTPQAAGNYDITVTVTGRNFVSGGSVSGSATTRVVCYSGTQPKPSGNTYTNPLKNFACGQYSESGNGYGWSCGSALGYQIWTSTNTSYIKGNQFAAWQEPGIIWVQDDRNGNGVPDETWYEQTGNHDQNSHPYKALVTRRYAIAYFNGSERIAVNEYGQTMRDVFWVDSKGRTGRIPGGFPVDWGVPDHVGSRVIYSGTLLLDDGQIGTGKYNFFDKENFEGYVDAGPSHNFSSWPRVNAAGAVVSTGVKFVKVQTAAFRYGGVFGDVSTEIAVANGLPDQSGGFVIPDY